jgi:glycosyltransferase involved in cell wall biosynthesis
MKEKNLLYLHQYYYTNTSSTGTRSYEFSRFLSKNGIRVHIITGTEPGIDTTCTNLFIHSTRTKYSHKMSGRRRILSFLTYNIKAIIKGLQIGKIDIVFATSTPLTIGFPAVIISRLKKAKMVFEVRDIWPDIPIELGYVKNKIVIKLLKKFEMWIYRNSQKIIVLSSGMYENLVDKGVDREKISIIENMANLYLYDAIKHSKREDNIKDKFVCIHPGTIGHVNGVDYILEVAREVVKTDKDIVFLLIGDGKEKKHIEKRVEDENLFNVLLREPVKKREIAKIIKASDIGIMCVNNSYSILQHNCANKLFDFMAAGLPILINYGGWQKDIIEKTNCGRSDIDPRAMANTILKLKSDNALRKEMKKNSRTLAEKKYSNILASKKLLGIINNL